MWANHPDIAEEWSQKGEDKGLPKYAHGKTTSPDLKEKHKKKNKKGDSPMNKSVFVSAGERLDKSAGAVLLRKGPPHNFRELARLRSASRSASPPGSTSRFKKLKDSFKDAVRNISRGVRTDRITTDEEADSVADGVKSEYKHLGRKVGTAARRQGRDVSEGYRYIGRKLYNLFRGLDEETTMNKSVFVSAEERLSKANNNQVLGARAKPDSKSGWWRMTGKPEKADDDADKTEMQRQIDSATETRRVGGDVKEIALPGVTVTAGKGTKPNPGRPVGNLAGTEVRSGSDTRVTSRPPRRFNKSLDPVLDARRNTPPQSILGGVGTSEAQYGMYHDVIADQFVEKSIVIEEDTTRRINGLRPIKKA